MRILVTLIFTLLFAVQAGATCDDELLGIESAVVQALRIQGYTGDQIEDHVQKSHELFARFQAHLGSDTPSIAYWAGASHDRVKMFRTLTGILDSNLAADQKRELARRFIFETMAERKGATERSKQHGDMGRYLEVFEAWAPYFTFREMRGLLRPFTNSLDITFPSVLGAALPRLYKYFGGDFEELYPLIADMQRGEFVSLLSSIPYAELSPRFPYFFARAGLNLDSPVKTSIVRPLPASANTMHCCNLNESFFDVAFNSPSAYVNLVYIRVNGVIAGAIKFNGANVFLGMANMIDEAGRIVVAKGVIYSPEQELVAKAEHYAKSSPDRHRHRMPLIYDINDLGLKPTRIIGLTGGEPEEHYLSRTSWMARIERQLSEIAQDLAEAI